MLHTHTHKYQQADFAFPRFNKLWHYLVKAWWIEEINWINFKSVKTAKNPFRSSLTDTFGNRSQCIHHSAARQNRLLSLEYIKPMYSLRRNFLPLDMCITFFPPGWLPSHIPVHFPPALLLPCLSLPEARFRCIFYESIPAHINLSTPPHPSTFPVSVSHLHHAYLTFPRSPPSAPVYPTVLSPSCSLRHYSQRVERRRPKRAESPLGSFYSSFISFPFISNSWSTVFSLLPLPFIASVSSGRCKSWNVMILKFDVHCLDAQNLAA